MTNLLAAGFMFVGGAILMLAGEYAKWVPIIGSIIALIGLGMLIYYLFSTMEIKRFFVNIKCINLLGKSSCQLDFWIF